jgi:hypothetical protein
LLGATDVALRRAARDVDVRGRLARVEQGFFLVIAGVGARQALHPGEVAAGVEEDREVARWGSDADGDYVLETLEGEAETGGDGGGCGLRPGEAPVDGLDSVAVSAQDGSSLVVVRHCLVVAGLKARAADDLECASSSMTRHWRNKLINLS